MTTFVSSNLLLSKSMQISVRLVRSRGTAGFMCLVPRAQPSDRVSTVIYHVVDLVVK